MANGPLFEGVLKFMSDAGVYTVILPFLLVFAMVFAILEKTKVFGEEEVGGQKYTRKNINAIVSFAMAFFVVGSSQLVEIVLKVSSQVFVVMLCVVLALILVGTFSKEDEGYFTGPYKIVFMIVVGLSLLLIILNAVPIGDKTILSYGYQWLAANISSTIVASVIMIAIVVGVLIFITSEDLIRNLTKPKKKE